MTRNSFENYEPTVVEKFEHFPLLLRAEEQRDDSYTMKARENIFNSQRTSFIFDSDFLKQIENHTT